MLNRSINEGTENVYCSKCGQKSADSADFCSLCGNALRGELLPATSEIEGKTYTRGSAGGKYESLYLFKNKWYAIENGRPVRQYRDPWDRTHWTVRLLLLILLFVIVLSLAGTWDDDFNEGLKILTGIDFSALLDFRK